MTRLDPYYTQLRTPVGGASTFTRALNPDAGRASFTGSSVQIAGDVVEGLRGFAAGTGELAEFARQEADRLRREDVANTLAQNADVEIRERVRAAAAENGAGYASALQQALEDHSIELSGRLPDDDETQRLFREERSKYTRNLYQQATADEYQMRIDYGVRQADNSLRALQNKVTLDPKFAQTAIEQGNAVIAAVPGRTKTEIAALQDAYERNIYTLRYTGMLEAAKSAGAVAVVQRLLESEGVTRLDTEALRQLTRAARTQRASFIERARSQAVSKVRGLAQANSEGRPLTQEEAAAAVQAAAATGDPEIIRAAATQVAYRRTLIESASTPLSVQLSQVQELYNLNLRGELDAEGRERLAMLGSIANQAYNLATSDTATYLARAGQKLDPIFTVSEDGNREIFDNAGIVRRLRQMSDGVAEMGLSPSETKPLTQAEARAALSMLHTLDTSEYSQLLGALESAPRGMRDALIKQLGIEDPLASAPMLALRNGADAYVQVEVARGVELLKQDGSRASLGLGTGRNAANVVAFEDAMRGTAYSAASERERQSLRNLADAAYAVRARENGYGSEFNAEAYRQSLYDVMGRREGTISGYSVPLPKDVTDAEAELVMGSFVPELMRGLVVDGIASGPKLGTGEDVPAEVIQEQARLIHVGSDVYALQMPDGTFVTALTPQQKEGDRPFRRYEFRLNADTVSKARAVQTMFETLQETDERYTYIPPMRAVGIREGRVLDNETGEYLTVGQARDALLAARRQAVYSLPQWNDLNADERAQVNDRLEAEFRDMPFGGR